MSQTRGRHLAARRRRRPPLMAVAAVALAAAFVALGTFVVLDGEEAQGQPCQGDGVVLQVTATPEQASLLQWAAERYGEDSPAVGDRCVEVRVEAVASAAAVAALLKDWEGAAGARPDVWVPTSSVWVRHLGLQRKAAGLDGLLPADRPSIATSPTVIAMPRPMAKAAGWPERSLNWGVLLEAMRDPAGWGAFGHPEWGPVKVGQTDPTVSTAALQGLLGATRTVTGGDLSVRALAAKQDELRRLLLAVGRAPGPEAKTSAELLAGLRKADAGGKALTFLSALALQERTVWAYNQGNLGDGGPPKVPLVAIYPTEGSFQSDYPWVVLEAPWVTEAKRAAAASFLDFVRGDTVQAHFQEAGLRSPDGTPGPPIDPASGLLPNQPEHIVPLPDPQAVAATLKGWVTSRQRANLVAVLDVSGSMQAAVPGTADTKMSLVRKAAARGMELFLPETVIDVWVFSANLDGARDWRSVVGRGPVGEEVAPGKTRRQALIESVAGIEAIPNGQTALYDTTWDAFQHVRDTYMPGRINAVVLLTDGRNEVPGGLTLDELLSRLKDQPEDRRVRVITIAYGADADTEALARIAETTGGISHVSNNPLDIERVFVKALSEL